MAILSHRYFAFFLVIFAISLKICYCQNGTDDSMGWGAAGVTWYGEASAPGSVDDSMGWGVAGVTWYGEASGPGSVGGACGYGSTVANPPFNAMVSAGGPSLFNNGKGCGTCYQIMCNGNPACSGKQITVTITDECPGCVSEPFHFDLSGRSMGALAKPGQADRLRGAGVLRVSYKRVPCLYKGTTIALGMDAGANPYYVAFAVEYENGDGDLSSVEIQPAGGKFMPMQEMRSAVWKINSGGPLKGPFSVRLTSGESRKVVVAKNVIPANWKAGQTYRSLVNF